MYCCNKRKLSVTDESVPVFSLDKYEGYAKVTDVYDGDTLLWRTLRTYRD